MYKFILLAGAALVGIAGLATTRFQDPAGIVAGRFTDVNGRPVRGMNVAITSEDATTFAERVTDEDGGFSFGGLTPGRYRVSIRNNERGFDPSLEKRIDKVSAIDPASHAFSGREDAPFGFTDVVLTPEELQLDVSIQLVLAAVLEGTIRLQDNAPVADVQVASSDGWGTNAVSDENGAYRLRGLNPRISEGKVLVNTIQVVTEDGRNVKQEVFITHPAIDIRAGETAKADLTVRAVRPSIESLRGGILAEKIPFNRDNANRLEKQGLMVGGSAGVTICLETPDKTRRYTTAASKEVYSLFDVPPGEYDMIAYYSAPLAKLSSLNPGPIVGRSRVRLESEKQLVIDLEIGLKPEEKIGFTVK